MASSRMGRKDGAAGCGSRAVVAIESGGEMTEKTKERKFCWETVQTIRLEPGQEVHIKPGNPLQIEVRQKKNLKGG